jgi:hypothetical protein
MPPAYVFSPKRENPPQIPYSWAAAGFQLKAGLPALDTFWGSASLAVSLIKLIIITFTCQGFLTMNRLKMSLLIN